MTGTRCGNGAERYTISMSMRRPGDKAWAPLLIDEMMKRLASLGAPRVVLMTATQNTNAQQLFHRMGFRTTMLEMTKECL